MNPPWMRCLSEIKAMTKEIDLEGMTAVWEAVRKSAEEVKAVIICLTHVTVTRTDVAREIRRVRGSVNSVFKGQLVECDKLSNYGNQCKSMLQGLKEEIRFRHMDLDEFLKECGFHKDYTFLFEDDEIAEAMEILQMDFTSNEMRKLFKLNMGDGDFKILMNKIDSAEANHFYITNPDHMEFDLKKMGQETKRASTEITDKLVRSLSDTRDVLGKVVKHLEAEKAAASALTAVFSMIGVAGVILLTGGAAAPGLVISGTALTGAIISQCETEKLAQRLANTKATLSRWESKLGNSIIQWQTLVVKFKELVKLLKESRAKLREEELHDMRVAISDSEKALGKFVEEVTKYEVLVRDIIKL